MKKALLLLGLVVATSSSSFISPAFSNTHSVSVGQVPEEVVATYNGVVSDVMNNWYPNNGGFNSDGVSWTREKGAWTCNGDVMLNDGSGGINVVSGYFKNTGEFVSLNYNVIQP
jgi:hypothetical protein